MKNTLALFGIGLAVLLLSSAAFAQKASDTKDSKKTRHIKMMKIENGKKMELDTVITGEDVFIWNGDTLNPAKHIKKFNSSGFDKMHQIDVDVEHNDGNENVRVFKHRNGKPGEQMIMQMGSGDDVQVITELEGDSLRKKIVIRKRLKDGCDEDNFSYLNDSKMKHFPPIPPPPPVPGFSHKKVLKSNQSRRVIDLNDPNIISYKKKELSGGREKIEIIRKKSEGSGNMTFNFDFDDEMMPPEPPEPPVFMNEFEKNGSEMNVDEENAPKENK